MRPELFVVLSGCLTFGLPLMFAVREVMVLRRGGSGGGEPPAPPRPPVPKPLPPCLLAPFRQPHRSRTVDLVREPA